MADIEAAPLPARIAVVTVNYRTPDLALACVRSLAAERARWPDLRVIVVDGGSGDGSAERLARAFAAAEFAGWVELLALEINGGFGWANNQAILRLLQGADPPDLIHLLNPDARAEPGAITALAEFMAGRRDCGAVGSLLLDEDGAMSGSAFRFPSAARELVRGLSMQRVGALLGIPDMLLLSSGGPIEADWVSGASVMFRSDALRRTGLFDDGYFLYFEEVELMWRMRRGGWTIWHQPASRIVHAAGASTGVSEREALRGARRRRPRYWYDSQRRFFVARAGMAGAVTATLAWTGGHLACRLFRLFGLRRGTVAEVAREMPDRWRFGLLPRRSDRRPAIAEAGAARGTRPAWMQDHA